MVGPRHLLLTTAYYHLLLLTWHAMTVPSASLSPPPQVLLLYKEGSTSLQIKQQIAGVVAHELAHQWWVTRPHHQSLLLLTDAPCGR